MTAAMERAVVVGAGTMGHGIAQVLAQAGLVTTIVDRRAEALAGALQKVRGNLDVGVRKAKLSAQDADRALARLDTSTELGCARDAALFVEAIYEDLDAKKALFRAADSIVPAGALLASNTSSLSITAIAGETTRPGDVVGLHFFNPVHLMKLVEIVRTEATKEETIARAQELCVRLQKTFIVVKDSPGFATSRLGVLLGFEAMRMLEQGVASARDIDLAMTLGYGHPMGPLELSDHVGLDVRLAIGRVLRRELSAGEFSPPAMLERLVGEGKVGKKAGRGIYLWEEGRIIGEGWRP